MISKQQPQTARSGGMNWNGATALDPSDGRLMALVAAGDGWALAKVYERYSRLVLHTALKYIHDLPGAEEMVQEVFFKVWRHAGQYRPERSRLSTWLIRMTQNQCIDELRKRRVRPMGEPIEEESDLQAAGADDPGRQLEHAFERVRVERALDRIPSEQRRVLEMAFFEGLSHPEIATLCGDPLGTVKTRLRLGMTKLRGILEEE